MKRGSSLFLLFEDEVFSAGFLNNKQLNIHVRKDLGAIIQTWSLSFLLFEDLKEHS